MKIELTIPLKHKVHVLLLNHPELRDNDNALAIKIWSEQDPLVFDYFTNSFHFVKLFTKGELIPFESIRRTRQKVQELYPAARGEFYGKRRKNIPDIINALQSPEMNA